MPAVRTWIFAICALLVSSPAALGQCSSLTLSRIIGTSVRVLESRDNLVFLAQPGLVEIYDLVDPASPRRVTSLPIRYEPSAMEVHNNLLFVATFDWSNSIGSLVIADITTIDTPLVLADITWNEEITDIASSNNRLCLLNIDDEIRVLDITTPGQPITGNTLAAQDYESIQVRQNILYTTFRDFASSPSRLKLRTVNITDIVNTNVINTIDLGTGDGTPRIDRLDATLAVVAADRLSLFDLTSTPGNPALLGSASGARIDSVPKLVSTGGSTLCHMFTGEAPAGVWDVTNPAAPIFRSGYGSRPIGVAPAGSAALCFDEEFFVSYSFATPTSPIIRWVNDYELPGRCLELDSAGNLLVFPEIFHPVADRITLLDATDVDDVELVSSLVLPVGVSLQSARADGDLLAVLTRGSSAVLWDLALYDISDPAHPLLLSEGLEIENTAFFANIEFELDGNLAMVEFFNRSVIIDVNDPTQPRIASFIPQTAQGKSHLDDGLLVTHFDGATPRFEVRDVSDPDRPVLLATINETTDDEFSFADRMLVFERSNTEAVVYDLSIPSAPNLRSTIAPPPAVGTVRYVNCTESLCLISGDEGHALYSLASPSSPVLVGEFALPNYPTQAIRTGRTFWVSDAIEAIVGLTLPQLPDVTQEPFSRRACAGATIVLNADAISDTPMSYRWRYNGTNLANGTLPNGSTVSGAFTRTLTISNFNPADAGIFNLRFTNSCGAVLSANAIVSAGSNPFFFTVPTQQFGCVRGPISFTVSTNFPTSTSIRWQAELPHNSGNFVNLSDFTTSAYSVSGAFTPTLTFTPLPGGRLTDNLHTRYRAVATTICGSTTSTAARMDLCTADFNCDLLVDLFDYLDFVDAFANVAAGSDFNADGVTDFFDYLDFVAAFATGC